MKHMYHNIHVSQANVHVQYIYIYIYIYSIESYTLVFSCIF